MGAHHQLAIIFIRANFPPSDNSWRNMLGPFSLYSCSAWDFSQGDWLGRLYPNPQNPCFSFAAEGAHYRSHRLAGSSAQPPDRSLVLLSGGLPNLLLLGGLRLLGRGPRAL